MNLSTFDIIFCDLDGTLLEDKKRHYECYKDIIIQYGGNPISKDEYWNGKRHKIRCDDLLKKSEFKESMELYRREWIQRIEQEKYLSFQILKPRISKVINFFKKNVKQVNLITMRKNKKNLIDQLTKFGIIESFDSIYIGTAESDNKKSDLIDGYYGKKTLTIGDSEDDMELAMKIGSSFLAVTNGIRIQEYLNADYYCKELEDLL
ncbi:MAG: HAD hydrolase-like protein [Dorea sp.]|nr:HAD hydrolase-like protein [Dorea sp.]